MSKVTFSGIQRKLREVGRSEEKEDDKVRTKITTSSGLVIEPSTEDSVAIIDLDSIDKAVIEEFIKKLIGDENQKYPVKLYISKKEAIRPEARKRLKSGNILSSST